MRRGVDFKRSVAVYSDTLWSILLALLTTAVLIILVLLIGDYADRRWGSDVIGFLRSNFGVFAMPTMLLFSTMTAALFAARNVRGARETVRLQETLRFIRTVELDREYILAKAAWSKHRGGAEPGREESLASLIAAFFGLQIADKLEKAAAAGGAEEEQQRQRALAATLAQLVQRNHADPAAAADIDVMQRDAQFILTYLNQFEIIGLGVRENIIDDEMYDSWHGTHVVQTWNDSKRIIGALQVIKNSKKLYVEWQARARDWATSRGREIAVAEPTAYTLEDLAKLALDVHQSIAERAAD